MATSEEKINPHQGHRERLRQRFLSGGLKNFAPHEVLELLLFQTVPRANTNPLAHKLISRFGSLSRVLDADANDLKTVEGIGDRTAVFLNLIGPLTRYYLRDAFSRQSIKLSSPEAAAEFIKPLLLNRKHEAFYVISLNSQCQAIHSSLISQGVVNETRIYPRQVAEVALRHNATSIILAHNHPSGHLSPSESDLKLTKELQKLMNSLQIPILDHVIVAHEQTFSFAAAGLL